MVEVFKTDVEFERDADKLVRVINSTFANYQANFDLEDDDNILRVKSLSEEIVPKKLVILLKHYGFNAEILTDS